MSSSLYKGHFAFMTAQGIDAHDSWDRYLRIEGEHVDELRVRGTTARIRSEFAAAAHCELKHGTARLVLLDVAKLEGKRDAAQPEGIRARARHRGFQPGRAGGLP